MGFADKLLLRSNRFLIKLGDCRERIIIRLLGWMLDALLKELFMFLELTNLEGGIHLLLLSLPLWFAAHTHTSTCTRALTHINTDNLYPLFFDCLFFFLVFLSFRWMTRKRILVPLSSKEKGLQQILFQHWNSWSKSHIHSRTVWRSFFYTYSY